MTFLVFGKTGQVATELARLGDVHCLDRAAADLSDPGACAEIIRKTDARAIINAAAYTAVDKAESDADAAKVINGEAPAAMARAAKAKGVPFLHISTDYVFDGSGARPWQPEDATAPVSVYGRTNRLGEAGILAAGGQNAILRTSWVFSAHGNNFVKTMLRMGRERDALTVVADQTGGPTPAAAIAACLLTMAGAMVRVENLAGLYHFSGAPDATWAGFAREIFRQSGLKVAVSDIPSSAYPVAAERPKNSRLNCDSLTARFGIARPDWKAGLADVLKELKDSTHGPA